MAFKILRTYYIDIDYVERLIKLSKKTRVPQAIYIREGVEMMLKKYEDKINEFERRF